MFGQNGTTAKPATFIALELAFHRLKEQLEAFERGEYSETKDRIFISAEQLLRANRRAWNDISTSRSYVTKEGLRRDREEVLVRSRAELTTGRYAEILEAHPKTRALLKTLWPDIHP